MAITFALNNKEQEVKSKILSYFKDCKGKILKPNVDTIFKNLPNITVGSSTFNYIKTIDGLKY